MISDCSCNWMGQITIICETQQSRKGRLGRYWGSGVTGGERCTCANLTVVYSWSMFCLSEQCLLDRYQSACSLLSCTSAPPSPSSRMVSAFCSWPLPQKTSLSSTVRTEHRLPWRPNRHCRLFIWFSGVFLCLLFRVTEDSVRPLAFIGIQGNRKW